jgi:DNA polymerase-3 subunit delta'
MPAPLLSQLRAQETARTTVERAIERDRVHHAYLFCGPNGVGKELAAFGLAQALVCERRSASDAGDQAGLFGGGAPSASSGVACGECSACLRAVPRAEERTPVHPDVVVVERGLYAPQAIGRRTQETQDISIDQVRTLVLARSAFAPHEGRAKVFIIRRAEELSVSAANALLKTLEEPGQKTHFILLSAQPEALLPTILSRTLKVRFAPLPDDLVAELLETRGVEKKRAKEVARLAGGSVETGELLADPEESEARERFVGRALEAISERPLDGVLALAEDAKKEKDALPSRIAALASTLADRAGAAAREGSPDAEVLANRGRFALTALEHLAGNSAPQMVVEAMLTRMRAI